MSSAPRPAPRRDFLEHLARPLLVRLLTPFEAPLAAASFRLSALAAAPLDDRRLVRALHDLLDDATDASLAPLVDLLHAVAKVATAAGRESLIKVDAARRLPARLGAEDLAATAYLDHPDLFALVRVSSAADAIRNFVLYEARADREPCFDSANVEAARELLAAWFVAHHRTAHCQIFVKRRGAELHFEISHGKTPTTVDLIDDALATKVVTQVSTQRSYAIYDESTRLLAVHSLEFIKQGLRESFGRGFAGDAGYFARAESLLDAAPLRDLDAALAPDVHVGVSEVELREIEIVARDGSSAAFSSSKADLRTTLQRMAIDGALAAADARVVHVKLAVSIAGARRPLLVVLKPARNQLDYDRRDRRAERALLDWLAARAIWRAGRRAPVAEAVSA